MLKKAPCGEQGGTGLYFFVLINGVEEGHKYLLRDVLCGLHRDLLGISGEINSFGIQI